MDLEDVTATLKKLRREVAQVATPARKREWELYSAPLDVLKELDDSLDVAGITNIEARLVRLEERL